MYNRPKRYFSFTLFQIALSDLKKTNIEKLTEFETNLKKDANKKYRLF